MEAKKLKLQAKSILKRTGKYLYNEDGSPVVVGGKYLFLNQDGSTALLNEHPNYENIERDIARITEGEDAIEEMALDLENTLESAATDVAEPASEDNQDVSSDVNWDATSTRLLLSLYKIMKELVDQRKIPTLKKMWIKMAGRLQEHGFSFTPCQVENRYKTLLRSYRRKLESSLRKGRLAKDIPYERELKELYERDRKHADILITPEGEQMTIADFLEAAGISGDRPVHYIAGTPKPKKVYTFASEVAPKPNLKRPISVAASTPPKPAPPSSPPYYTNHARRPDVMEEMRDLRENTLEKLRTMEDKRDEFNKKVLHELRYRNELLEKLLEHVP